jgi:hypothetical protein
MNMILMTNDDHFGEQMVGTREDFRNALMDNFREWYRDYQGALDLNEDIGMTFSEYVENSLDEHLSVADQYDIADCERINA